MHILLDLDGTLVDTNSPEFDQIKYGRDRSFCANDIPLFPGAERFVQDLKAACQSVTIVSDSHPAYVEQIAEKRLGLPYLALCNKPNTAILRSFLANNFEFPNKVRADEFLLIGDKNIDIYLARGLSIPSVFLDFRHSSALDASKNRATNFKFGGTYYCCSYKEVSAVIANPEKHRLALEDPIGRASAHILTELNGNGGYNFIRGLARQNQGPCDRFGALQCYYDFQRGDRKMPFLRETAQKVGSYIREVLCADITRFPWDYVTCVADKRTTKPPRKMRDLLWALDVPIPKVELFSWSDEVESRGSIRQQKTRLEREAFVKEFLIVSNAEVVNGKNIIVLDDQYTTGATAQVHMDKLVSIGAKNVMFVPIFFLADNVASEKRCPECGKITSIKYSKNGVKPFYSCVPPQYNGMGCGWMEWVK